MLRTAAPLAALVLLLAASLPGGQAAAKKRSASRATIHEVVAGDILGSLAQRYGCSVEELRRANDLQGDLIRLGQKLTIPECSGRPVEGRAEVTVHLVTPGDTLSQIAERYGTSIEAVKRRNKLKSNKIRACMTLQVLPSVPTPIRSQVSYVIGAGDTLDRIARVYRTSHKEITCLNPKKAKNPAKLRIGDRLKLLRYGPANPSETVGRPQDGKLVNGEQLPPGPGYYRRRPHRAWGTNETIMHLLEAVAAVRGKHTDVHDVAVGDISDRDGGRLAGHKSHQSGRDVDLGLYFTKQPKKGPKAFISANKHAIDLAPNWTLLVELAGAKPQQRRAEYVFLDYRVQEKLYKWAKKKGKPQALLDRMFQYPRGKRAMRGVVRHEPGHADHYHIRFKCPRDDQECI